MGAAEHNRPRSINAEGPGRGVVPAQQPLVPPAQQLMRHTNGLGAGQSSTVCVPLTTASMTSQLPDTSALPAHHPKPCASDSTADVRPTRRLPRPPTKGPSLRSRSLSPSSDRVASSHPKHKRISQLAHPERISQSARPEPAVPALRPRAAAQQVDATQPRARRVLPSVPSHRRAPDGERTLASDASVGFVSTSHGGRDASRDQQPGRSMAFRDESVRPQGQLQPRKAALRAHHLHAPLNPDSSLDLSAVHSPVNELNRVDTLPGMVADIALPVFAECGASERSRGLWEWTQV
jgi:hypothetical protein